MTLGHMRLVAAESSRSLAGRESAAFLKMYRGASIDVRSRNTRGAIAALFGLLAVQLAVSLTASHGALLGHLLAGAFFLVSVFFVHRSFYGMRIRSGREA